ncbi:MAG: hypothetical protein KJO63_05710, partial [Maribacter sp.]|nr:hypothetical protein [Maribacter sp.]
VYMKASLKKSLEMKTVPFKGNFISSPSAQDFIACTGDNVPGTNEPLFAVISNKVEGNATHLGVLDYMKSPLIVEACDLDAQTGILSVTLNITFKNKKGDGIRILGVSNISLAGPASGSYEVVEGFGKFEGATGAISTTGFFNGNTGVAEFRAEGSVTQPNR